MDQCHASVQVSGTQGSLWWFRLTVCSRLDWWEHAGWRMSRHRWVSLVGAWAHLAQVWPRLGTTSAFSCVGRTTTADWSSDSLMTFTKTKSFLRKGIALKQVSVHVCLMFVLSKQWHLARSDTDTDAKVPSMVLLVTVCCTGVFLDLKCARMRWMKWGCTESPSSLSLYSRSYLWPRL